MGGGLRCFGGLVAFGFAAMWIMASLAAALVCLLSAVVAYGVISAVERARTRRLDRARRSAAASVALPSRPPDALLPQWAEVLNSDLGHVYEPTATTSALSREAEYGWPSVDDTVVTSGPLQ